ncbi:MAG: hypothetical protein R3E58_19985 [Phycisphaerae bacterium]|nr:hypothetical protein [Phycisphaerales bacterium]
MLPVASRFNVAVCLLTVLVIDLGYAALTHADERGVPLGDCCLVHPGPGCDDFVVQDCVCGLDPFCCDTNWDHFCVDQAINACGVFCPQSEACCDAGTGCFDLAAGDCLNIAGNPQGPGTDCDLGVCDPVQTGACCLPDGVCTEAFNESECLIDNCGELFDLGSSCDLTICPFPQTGKCCLPFGACQDLTSCQCAQAGGFFEPTADCLGLPGECPVFVSLVFNELEYDNPGSDTAEFVELYAPAGAGQPANGWKLEFYNGGVLSGSNLYKTIDLSSTFIPVDGFLVVGDALVPNVDLIKSGDIQNGTGRGDGIVISFNGVVVEALSYAQNATTLGFTAEGGDGDGTFLPNIGVSDSAGVTLQRLPDGETWFETINSTPGGSNFLPFDLDCNNNDIPDNIDISEGTSNDVNTNGIPDECEPDCNGNGVPDDVDIANLTSNDINTNGIPDECEADCDNNHVPDSWEIAQGTATDLDTNGIPDLCDILECRYTDLNYNNLPDAIEIAEGSAADANTNGIIDEAEEPAGEHSALALLRRASNGPLFVGPDGLPLKVKINSNGTIALDSNGFVIPDPNGKAIIDYVRDDELAEKLKDALIDTNGPNPVSRIKHVKVFMQSCHGGGMLDDLAKAFGQIVCWVGGSASRSNEVARADGDGDPDPMGHWARALRDALVNTNGTVLQSLKIASRLGQSSPIQKPGSRKVERSVYVTSGKGGEELIPLYDPEATSHHAIIIAGITDQDGIENEITRFCELLESQWGDLDTNGTSVHVLFGTGTTNPCTSTNVPNANILPATFGDLCDLIMDMTTNGTFNPNEELLIFGGDHGLGSVEPVNKAARRGGGRGVEPPTIEQEFLISSGYKFSMTRDPGNDPYIRVVASGPFAPGTVSVSLNGVVYGYLDPNAAAIFGIPETRVFVPEGSLHIGPNDLTIKPNGQPVVVLETEFVTGAIAPIPTPGWGDFNGDSDVDLNDLPDFAACLAGPGAGYVGPNCAYADIDEDGDVDMQDARLFQSVFTGGLP